MQTDVKNLQTTRLLREEYTLKQAKAFADRYAAVLNRWPGLGSTILCFPPSKNKNLLENVVPPSLNLCQHYPAVSRREDKQPEWLSYHVKNLLYWADYEVLSLFSPLVPQLVSPSSLRFSPGSWM